MQIRSEIHPCLRIIRATMLSPGRVLTTLALTSLCAVTSVQAEEPIELESSFVGDKEQPAVSYFVPWKGPEGADKLYQKQEDKYEKSIDSVDREVMLRSMRIYNEMNLEGKAEF